jgi:hypothetical protein
LKAPLVKVMTMKDSNSRSKSGAPKSSAGRPFKEMTRSKKFVSVFKVVVCVSTFGFVFPNVMDRDGD